MLFSGVPDPVFKNKKIYFPITEFYHKNYTENITLTEQFERWQSYFVLYYHTIFDKKVSRLI